MRKGMRQARATFGRMVGRRLFIISAVLAVAMTALFVGGYRERPAVAAAQQPTGAVNYHQAQIVKEAPVLDGDPADGRCKDQSVHCFKDNKDFLNGQRSMLRIEDFGIAARTRNSGEADDYYVGGIATTADSAITSVKASSLSGGPPTGTESAPATIGARLFNGGQEALVSAVALRDGDLSIVADLSSGSVVGLGDGLAQSATREPELTAATADFNDDSTEEVVFATNNVIATLQAMSAKDPSDPKQGLRFGPPKTVDNMVTMVTGNFLGTGDMVVTLVPNADGTVSLEYFSVDPTTLAFTQQQSLTFNRPAGAGPAVYGASIAVGRFNGAAFTNTVHDQMVITVWDNARVDLFTVDADFSSDTPKPVLRLQEISSQKAGQRPVLRAGRFNWTSPFDTVAYMLTDAGNTDSPSVDRNFQIVTFDANLKVAKQEALTALEKGQCIYDMQAGNFDRRQPDPSPTAPSGATIHNPNLQLAFLTSTATNSDGICSGGDSGDLSKGMTLSVWSVNVDATSGALSVEYTSGYTWSSFTEARINWLSLTPVDLEGRSMVLGEPRVWAIHRSQPSVVLAAPPMHADYLDDALTNFTFAPRGFFTNYETSSSSSLQGTTTSTTSWSFSAEETLDTYVSEGNCDIGDCAKIDNKFSAKQALDGSTSTLSGTADSQTLDLKTQTGATDNLWLVDSVLTMYIYPVLGKSVCPATKPDCSADEKVPMTVMFAGRDSVKKAEIDAVQVPWYQPPWMPGNVLSYPGTLDQLQRGAFADPTTFQLLSDVNTWFTDTSVDSEEVTWTKGSQSGSTTSFNQNYSFDDTVSLSVQENFLIGDVGASASLDVSGSFGFSNLTDSLTTLDSSQGIGFTKSAEFQQTSLYGYAVTPYIFGQTAPPTANGAPLTTDVQTFGILRSGWVVNPLDPDLFNPGTIWKDRYSVAPDLGFNHPSRWVLTNNGPANVCIAASAGSSVVDCPTLGARTPESPWDDNYHWMRGLFISNASDASSSDDGSGGNGPQLGSAIVGTKLLLRARVHNFSLAEMPQDTVVKVRFYAMPWDTSLAKPAGASKLINTVTMPPGGVPPFNTRTDKVLPNWALVETEFDTTPYPDKDLVFWVVTWMEDGSGALVRELPGKGLTAIPGTGATFDYADAAALDEAYGNNVGFYNQVFSVFASAPTQTPTAANATAPTVAITEVGSDVTSIRFGERAIVGARLQTREHAPRGRFTVHFVDGDPDNGGRIVGIQTLPRMRANTKHEFRASFRPQRCGDHTLYVVAGPGTRFEHTARLETINVECSQPPQCDTTCFRSPQYYLNNLWNGLPEGRVWIAGIGRPVSTRNVRAIGLALRGGQSARQSFNREHVAAQLSMLDAGLVGQQRSEVLNSTLSCYGVSGENVVLSNGAVIGPQTQLGELLGQAEWAARAGGSADWEKLAVVLGQLNSDDPAGGCVNRNPGE